MKILFLAHVDSHISAFHKPYIEYFSDKECIIDVASKGKTVYERCHCKYNINFGRKPLSFTNIKAFFQLKNILKNNKYDIVYCNTPIAGAIGRIAVNKYRSSGTKVIYSAHGFNFFQGNSKLLNRVYCTIEKYLSAFTDCMLTMNAEDFEACKKYNFKCKNVINVDGIGIDTTKFSPIDTSIKETLREENGYNRDDFIMIYPAELTLRKNQNLLFRIFIEIKGQIPNAKLLITGTGVLHDSYQRYIKDNNLDDDVKLLGFRNDILDLLRMSDILAASSLTEGLPVNVMEALSVGLPVVATKVRGHIDLIAEGVNGFLFDIDDVRTAASRIIELFSNKELYSILSSNARISVKKYDINSVLCEYDRIYRSLCEEFHDE